MTALILQDLLTDSDIGWQVHNCKLLQKVAEFDAPLPFYVHYDNLSDEHKKAHPLSFELLKRLDEPMSIETVANLTGADASLFKKSWQIKYIASVVIFCQPLQLALRFHISNTAKPAQAVYLPDETSAWHSQSDKWQAFGVVDVLYKGETALYSHAQDELALPALPQYYALASEHSLSVLALINQKQAHFDSLNKDLQNRLANI